MIKKNGLSKKVVPRKRLTPKRELARSENILVVANLYSYAAYSGRIKEEIQLESIKISAAKGRFVLISSDYKPKRLVLMEGSIPLFFTKFIRLEGEKAVQYIGKKSDKEFYVAECEFPSLLNQSLESLWSGQFIVEFESYGNISFGSGKVAKLPFGNYGNPDSITQSIDSVKLRIDLEGSVILQIEGWAFAAGQDSISVDLYFDDQKINSTLTNRLRPDVLEHYKINRPITPGFMLESRVDERPPRYVGIMVRGRDDGYAARFEFEKIPGAQSVIKTEETVFKSLTTPKNTTQINFQIYNQSAVRKKVYPLSIIIPTKLSTNNIYDLVKAIRQSSLEDEIIIIGHGVGKLDQEKLASVCDRYIQVEGKFNWSKFNNKGASVSTKEYLLFLNDDVLPISPNWRDDLNSSLLDSEVGVVGGRLIGKDLRIQHDGVSIYGLVTNHINLGATKLPASREGSSLDAVTGAFIATKKSFFNSLGGFDISLDVVGNDLDYCLKAGARDKKIVIAPNMLFFHAEGSSRANIFDNNFSKVLDLQLPLSGRMRALDKSRAIDVGEEPIVFFRKTALKVKSIAVVKVDHIGDFYSALPSIQMLRKKYPLSKISLICSPEVSVIAKSLKIFNDVLPVRIFNKESGRGYGNWNLPNTLLQKKFDVVLDLRKHQDAREIFEQLQGDRKFCFSSTTASKAPNLVTFIGHDEVKGADYIPSISDELCSFVSLVIQSIENYPEKIDMETIKLNFNKSPKSTVNKKKVAVFPLSGNEARVYPLTLYIEYAILEKLRNPSSEISFYLPIDQIGEYINLDSANLLKSKGIKLVGLSSSISVVEAIKRSTLVVTNNTGPMWIASELGVAAIAIFSGVVSRSHWLPKGVIQISRSVMCSPCYISHPDQCHRDMYCLKSIDPSYINLVSDESI